MKLQEFNDKLPVPIKTQISRIKPLCNGLYPHEVLLLSYVHKYKTENNHYEEFWKYKYGIDNLDDIIHSLYKRGYIELASLEQAMQSINTTDLKQLLKQNNLKVSGRKADLIERLLSHVPKENLSSAFAERNYVLTKLGKTILEKESYIHYIHTHNIDDLDIWKLSKITHNASPKPFKQNIWEYLEQKEKIYLSSKDYGLYRNCKFHKAELAYEEHHTELAFELLIETTCYDLSGLSSFFDDTPSQIPPRLFPYEHSYAVIAPGVAARIIACQKVMEIPVSELKTKILAVLRKINLPFQIFTAEECANIIILEIQDKKNEIAIIYKNSEIRFKQTHPDMYHSMMETYSISDQIHDDLVQRANMDNKIYDENFEQMLNSRLSKLGEPYKSEFFRIRTQRNTVNSPLSHKELDLLTLEAIERSYNSRTEQISPAFDPAKEYLQTKWGTYEMPEPYTVKLDHDPRNDAKPV